jgi:hypothetical protein
MEDDMPRVDGFLPSTSGLHFSNSFPNVPLKTVQVPGINVEIPILNAANGLCGGMVYTVRDYFEHGQSPPSLTNAPGDGPLFDYIVQRLIDSWELPEGVLRYVLLMNPDLPDFERPILGVDVFQHSRAWVMIKDEWPKIKVDLDSNHPSPLGLIKTKSADPSKVGENHQVLAYGYDLNGADLTLNLYDPNAPDNDGVTLEVSLADPNQLCNLRCNTAPELYCFFRTNYAPSSNALPGA